MSDSQAIEDAARDFLECFEGVFDHDWEFTQAALAEPRWLIQDGCTFLRPGVADEGSNWMNRGALLAAYRELRRVLPT